MRRKALKALPSLNGGFPYLPSVHLPLYLGQTTFAISLFIKNLILLYFRRRNKDGVNAVVDLRDRQSPLWHRVVSIGLASYPCQPERQSRSRFTSTVRPI